MAEWKTHVKVIRVLNARLIVSASKRHPLNGHSERAFEARIFPRRCPFANDA